MKLGAALGSDCLLEYTAQNREVACRAAMVLVRFEAAVGCEIDYTGRSSTASARSSCQVLGQVEDGLQRAADQRILVAVQIQSHASLFGSRSLFVRRCTVHG